MNNRILLIGAGNEGLNIIQKAKIYGLSVLNINSPKTYKDAFTPHLEDVVIIDYLDVERTVEYAKTMYKLSPFDAVISLSENALLTAAHVSEALGFQSNSVESVATLKHKTLMREKLNAHSVSVVPYQAITDLESLQSFAQKVQFPLIIKPVDGTRSENVFQVKSTEELKEVYQKISSKGSEYIAEQYLDGPEISVEAFSFNGQHVVVAITEKIINDQHIELGHVIPAQLPELDEAAVVRLTHEFLDAIGIVTGPTHTEMRLTSEGPRIIESHNRVGGDQINELMKLAYGVDMRGLTIGWQVGKEKAFSEQPTLQQASAIRFLTAEAGVVERVTIDDYGIQQIDGIESYAIKVKAGDVVKPLVSSSERIGFVITKGETREIARQRTLDFIQCVTVVTKNENHSC